MTNKEVYDLFQKMEKKFDGYCERQEKINDIVIRNDEKIKGIWKIPIISGATVTLITALGIFIAIIIK